MQALEMGRCLRTACLPFANSEQRKCVERSEWEENATEEQRNAALKILHAEFESGPYKGPMAEDAEAAAAAKDAVAEDAEAAAAAKDAVAE